MGLITAKVEKLKKMGSEAESLLVEKWREIEAMSKSEAASRHSDETQKAVAKLGKTLMKALKKIRKSEGELDAEVWSRHLEEKWQRAMDKFHRVVRRKEAKEEVK